MNDDWRYSPEKMKLREEVLQILLKKYGGQMNGVVPKYVPVNPSLSVLMIGSLKVTRPHLEWQNILRFTMQKVINVLAVLSFLGTVSIIGGGAYVYLSGMRLLSVYERESPRQRQKRLQKHFLLDAATPELPTMTGVLPLP